MPWPREKRSGWNSSCQPAYRSALVRFHHASNPRRARAGGGDHPRSGGHHGPARPRSSASKPEARGHRPAHRRDRARLQQSAHPHSRQPGYSAATLPRGSQGPEGDFRRVAIGGARAYPRATPSRVCAPSASGGAPGDLRDLVHGMLDLIGRSLGPRIEIRVDMPEDLPAARIDPNQLEVALLNLAVNARDAMPEGGTDLGIPRSDRCGRRAGLGLGSICVFVRRRYRHGHGARDAGAGCRAVLFHESGWQGHGPGAVDGARPRGPIGRAADPRKRAGKRDDGGVMAARG